MTVWYDPREPSSRAPDGRAPRCFGKGCHDFSLHLLAPGRGPSFPAVAAGRLCSPGAGDGQGPGRPGPGRHPPGHRGQRLELRSQRPFPLDPDARGAGEPARLPSAGGVRGRPAEEPEDLSHGPEGPALEPGLARAGRGHAGQEPGQLRILLGVRGDGRTRSVREDLLRPRDESLGAAGRVLQSLRRRLRRRLGHRGLLRVPAHRRRAGELRALPGGQPAGRALHPGRVPEVRLDHRLRLHRQRRGADQGGPAERPGLHRHRRQCRVRGLQQRLLRRARPAGQPPGADRGLRRPRLRRRGCLADQEQLGRGLRRGRLHLGQVRRRPDRTVGDPAALHAATQRIGLQPGPGQRAAGRRRRRRTELEHQRRPRRHGGHPPGHRRRLPRPGGGAGPAQHRQLPVDRAEPGQRAGQPADPRLRRQRPGLRHDARGPGHHRPPVALRLVPGQQHGALRVAGHGRPQHRRRGRRLHRPGHGARAGRQLPDIDHHQPAAAPDRRLEQHLHRP